MFFNFFVLIIFSIWSTIPSCLCYSVHHERQVFDVSASVKEARGVFVSRQMTTTSLEFEREKGNKFGNSISTGKRSSDAFFVSIHPRASVVRPKHGNYSALTVARLNRDEARLNSIKSRIRLALSNFTHSDLKPVQTAIQPEDLRSPLISGVSQGSGEYFARIGVGQPAKEFYMVVDTGSDVSWLQCEPCADCYQQSDPVFNPSASSTYRQLTCDSPQCGALEVSSCRTGCLYQVSYGDGSYTVGDFATETLTFGNSGTIPNVAIGCGHENEGLFIGSAGIIGLGGSSLSIPSQVKASSFSYCLVNRDSSSSSTLDFNSAPPSDSVVASMVKNPKINVYFYVDLTGIVVGGQKLAIPPSVFQIDGSGRGGVIVDSGTAITRLQSQAYEQLRDTFARFTTHLPSAGSFALFDTCYDLSSMTRVSVPTVAFEFSGGKRLQLKASNYLIPVDSSGKFCLAFASTSSPLSIIGNVQQQGTRVTYDIVNKAIGFSLNKC